MWLFEPLHGDGYQFWSGIGSDFQELTLFLVIGGLYAFLRRHNCHVKGCWRLAWHPSADHLGHPVCRHHHPHGNHPSLGADQ